MYTRKNYQKKAELIADLKAGKNIGYYQPGPFGGNEPSDGTVYLEGPHYPQAHKWYAVAKVKDGRIVQVDKHKAPDPAAVAMHKELDELIKVEGESLARGHKHIYE